MNTIAEITTICFDIDWTLVKHSDDIENNVLRKLGLAPNEEFNNQVRYFWDNLSKKLQNGEKVERNKIYSLASEMIPFLSKINLSAEDWFALSDTVDNVELIDGAHEVLDYLHNQGYYIVASTNWFAIDQIKVLKNLGILDFFERVYGWDTICAKPHRNALCSLMDIHLSDSIVFIGDSVYNDISFANKTGIKSIGFNLKYERKSKHIKPTMHINDLLEIKKIL